MTRKIINLENIKSPFHSNGLNFREALLNLLAVEPEPREDDKREDKDTEQKPKTKRDGLCRED